MKSFYDLLSQTYQEVLPIRLQTIDWIEEKAGHANLRNPLLLETGCASGQNSIELAARGYQVVGVDINTKMVEAARQNQERRQVLRKECLNLRFLTADMTRLDLVAAGLGVAPQNSLDIVLNLENTWSHLTKPGDMAAYAASVYQILKPGGIWFVESLDYDHLLANKRVEAAPLFVESGPFTFYRSYEVLKEGGTKVVGANGGSAKFEILYRFKDGREVGDQTVLAVTPLRQMEIMLQQGGFSQIEVEASGGIDEPIDEPIRHTYLAAYKV